MPAYYVRYNDLQNQALALQKLAKTIANCEKQLASIANAMDSGSKLMLTLKSKVKDRSKSAGKLSDKVTSAYNILADIKDIYLNAEKSVHSSLGGAASDNSGSGSSGGSSKSIDKTLSVIWNIFKKIPSYILLPSALHPLIGPFISSYTNAGSNSITKAVNALKTVENTAKIGQKAHSVLKYLHTIGENGMTLGNIKRIINSRTVNPSWLKQLMPIISTNVSKYVPSATAKWWQNFGGAFKRSILDDLADFKAGGAKAAFAWSGVALSGIINTAENIGGFLKKEMSLGRAITEIVSETGIDIVKDLAIGAAVAGGLVAAFGSAPILAVAVGTMAINGVADYATRYFTGGKSDDFTEWFSDGILDLGTGAVNAVKNGFNGIVNCFKNPTKVTAKWRLNFGF